MNRSAIINQAYNDGAIEMVELPHSLTFYRQNKHSGIWAFMNAQEITPDNWVFVFTQWEVTSTPPNFT